MQARSVKAGKCTLLLFEQIFKNGNLKFHFLIIMMNNFDTVAQVFQNKDKTFSNWKSFYTKWKDTSGCVKQWSVSAVLLFHRCSFPERNHACCTSVFQLCNELCAVYKGLHIGPCGIKHWSSTVRKGLIVITWLKAFDLCTPNEIKHCEFNRHPLQREMSTLRFITIGMLSAHDRTV